MNNRLLYLYLSARKRVVDFVTGKLAASGFAEQAVMIFVVATIAGIFIWIGTIVQDMLKTSGGML